MYAIKYLNIHPVFWLCTALLTSHWSFIKMNLLWMKIVCFFFFSWYKSFLEATNPISVLCVSGQQDILLAADLSGNLPIGILLRSYLSPVWTHHYLWVLLAAPKAPWPVTSSAYKQPHGLGCPVSQWWEAFITTESWICFSGHPTSCSCDNFCKVPKSGCHVHPVHFR